MTHRTTHWLALVDKREARLCRGQFVAGGRWRFEDVARLTSPWEKDHERGRPSALAASSSDGPFSLANPGHEAEEESLRFARDVAGWLEEHVERENVECLHVFAPPHFLGHLRAVMPDSLRGCVVDHHEHLGHLPAGELAAHPAVEAIVSGSVEATRAGG